MNKDIVMTVINVVMLGGILIPLVARGYRRRKPHWTFRSWVALGTALTIGLSFFLAGLWVTLAIDNHELWVGSPGSTVRHNWVTFTIATMFLATVFFMGPLFWFANGKADRQFPFTGGRRERERLGE